MTYHPFRHLGLKFLSIVVAVLLWLTVSGEQVAERSLRVPLEVRNIPERLEVVSELPSTVDVRARGASGALARLGPGDLVAILDVGSAKPGRRLFHMTPGEIQAPFELEIAAVSPPSVFIEFERSSVKPVPVVPTVEGDPAPGYVVGRISAEPATVEVVGPESRLRQLTEAVTEPVSVSGATQPVREEVTIGVADSTVRLRTSLRGWVTVAILPAPVERTIASVPVRLRHVSRDQRAESEPPVVAVTVRGPRLVLANLQADSIEAFVDLAGLGPGRYNLPVRTEPSQQVGVVGVTPPTVRMTIR